MPARWPDLPPEYLWPASLLSYVAWGLALYLIAKKTKNPNPWFAWVPILNVFLLSDIAGMGCLGLVLLLVPCINFFVAIYMWWKVCERLRKPGILSLLMLIPGVNVIVALYLGLSE